MNDFFKTVPHEIEYYSIITIGLGEFQLIPERSSSIEMPFKCMQSILHVNLGQIVNHKR